MSVDSRSATAVKQFQQRDTEISECIANCSEAAQACELCADTCAEAAPEMARCLRLCRDAAGLASLHARFMAPEPAFHATQALLVANAAEACREECVQHDMGHSQPCAAVLEPCIESCQAMAR